LWKKFALYQFTQMPYEQSLLVPDGVSTFSIGGELAPRSSGGAGFGIAIHYRPEVEHAHPRRFGNSADDSFIDSRIIISLSIVLTGSLRL